MILEDAHISFTLAVSFMHWVLDLSYNIYNSSMYLKSWHRLDVAMKRHRHTGGCVLGYSV